MALILNIETSTRICSVSISKNGKVLSFRESDDEKSHARLLNIFIKEILDEQQLIFDDFDAIAVSKGPGSYTGLRIGVSTAKGFCYAKDKPLIAINTLQSMAKGITEKVKNGELDLDGLDSSYLVPMIDARRMEVYSAFFNSEAEFVREVKAEIIEESSYKEILENKKMIFFGDGSEKIKETITHPNARFINNINPSSVYMAALSERAFEKKQFEDVAYFEPFYLKDFIASIPKKNIFN